VKRWFTVNNRVKRHRQQSVKTVADRQTVAAESAEDDSF
jgi:hypothetical protein